MVKTSTYRFLSHFPAASFFHPFVCMYVCAVCEDVNLSLFACFVLFLLLLLVEGRVSVTNEFHDYFTIVTKTPFLE
jgi:hypothetical protein